MKSFFFFGLVCYASRAPEILIPVVESVVWQQFLIITGLSYRAGSLKGFPGLSVIDWPYLIGLNWSCPSLLSMSTLMLKWSSISSGWAEGPFCPDVLPEYPPPPHPAMTCQHFTMFLINWERSLGGAWFTLPIKELMSFKKNFNSYYWIRKLSI